MSTPRFVGQRKNLALFESRGRAVFVDTNALTASIATVEDARKAHTSRGWDTSSNPDPVWGELASAALTREMVPTAITLAESQKRTYTVPKRVAQCASTALSLEETLSPAGSYVAELLASGSQISCEDVLWVSRYFDSHDESTTSRASWLSWGGHEGKRWAASLAARLDYDSVVADAGQYETPGIAAFLADEELTSFWTEQDEDNPQLVNHLFMLTPQGTWVAWGNGDWLDCDAPEPTPRFIELDGEAALYIAGALFDSPENPVDIRTPNPEAYDIAQGALADPDGDWEFVARTMRAAGDPPANPADYTPEERSKNASGQLRDANGRFAQVGATGAVKSSGLGGTIKSVDEATGKIVVDTSDGASVEIPSSDFEVGAAPHPKVDPEAIKADKTIDFTGIIAPATEPDSPKATLPNELPRMSSVDIDNTLTGYAERVTAERQAKAKEFKKLLEPEEVSVPGEETIQASASETLSDSASDVPPPSADPTPDKTDVEPVYLAIVDKEDPRAVTDLIALVPATAVTSDPKTYRRSGGKWIEDSQILSDLRSATPPAVVQLDADQYKDVLQQVDFSGAETPAEDATQSITSAGGLDRNRGGAEKLRRYWTVGPGGLKIRWNTGGDWTRCVRLLSKYLGPRAKGYCALRHHEMTGMWPGDRKNREMSSESLVAAGFYSDSSQVLHTMPAILRASANFAAVETAKARVYGTSTFDPAVYSADSVTDERSGRAFVIPLVIPEGVIRTGDGREFTKGALGMRTFPLPLMWQPATGEGHDTSYIVGRIDRMERVSNGIGNAYGVFDVGPYGQEAQRLVENLMLRWVSADLDKFHVDENQSDPDNGKMVIDKARVMGVTLVAKPAFQECTIKLLPIQENEMPETTPSAISASASIAAAIPVEPPVSWFADPQLTAPTPITVTNEGRVFGHIATWDTNHIGLAGQIRPPRSSSQYAYFHTGVVRSAEGSDVRVGQLTLSGGHAPIHLAANDAVKHYDDTHSAFADVHAGEDRYGIYVSGALRPGTTAAQVRAIRASAPSGDWRAINRRLELVAVCQVNVPGFPVPRSLVSAGTPLAMVAAGTGDLLHMLEEQNEETHAAFANAAIDRIDRILGVDEFLNAGASTIETTKDLRTAVRAYNKVASHKQPALRREIVRQARSLGHLEMVPTNWKELSLDEQALSYRDRYEELLGMSRSAKIAELSSRVKGQQDLTATVASLRARIEKK